MNAFVLFTKIPKAGFSKTRLQPDLTPRQSEALSFCLLADLIKEFSLPKSFAFWLAYTPKDELDRIRHILPYGFTNTFSQTEGDLGGRMLHAMEFLFAKGYKKVALAGSDIPALTRRHVEDAFIRLEENDLVLGPTEDGGYYLIASKTSPRKTLFRLRTWGNETVLDRTRTAGEKLGQTIGSIERLRDVDTVEDLIALPADTPAHTLKFVQSLRLQERDR